LINLAKKTIPWRGTIMGSKDKGKKEPKKAKKDMKKPGTIPIFEQLAEVEVVKKKRKEEFPE
jgi:hypothetical protein